MNIIDKLIAPSLRLESSTSINKSPWVGKMLHNTLRSERQCQWQDDFFYRYHYLVKIKNTRLYDLHVDVARRGTLGETNEGKESSNFYYLCLIIDRFYNQSELKIINFKIARPGTDRRRLQPSRLDSLSPTRRVTFQFRFFM